MGIYQRFGKRSIDIVIAGAGLLLGLPLLMVVAIFVLVLIGRPVIFRQRRAGMHGRPFHIVKFRTMLDKHDPAGNPLPDDSRLTRFGRLLRTNSIDELPELWNVLRGEMSLVGPRPLLMEYLERYTPEQSRRHEVKPGITGWAQVHGRNGLAWEQRFELDLWYARHCSPFLDLQILVLTVFAVLARRGISAEGHATMPRFDEVTAAETHDRVA